jgi:GTPase SAR1 family protein
LLIYDVTNRSSFENIRDWLAQVREYAKEEVELTLVGNKVDLGQQRKVRQEEGRQLAQVCPPSPPALPNALIQAYNIPFMETSAKSGQNVHELFLELTKRLLSTSQKKSGDNEGRAAVLDLLDQSSEQARRNWLGGGRCCGGTRG